MANDIKIGWKRRKPRPCPPVFIIIIVTEVFAAGLVRQTLNATKGTEGIMAVNSAYAASRERYAQIGVDTEGAIKRLFGVPVSLHCWQGDDVRGFEGALSPGGGIQATGNYPGVARNPDELMADIDFALARIPGRHRLNLHASYAILEDGEKVDRDRLEPRHFRRWVEFARQRGLGIDFNPTCFAHPMARGLTLSSPDKEVREFWIRHCVACLPHL